jgi:hypothetical protein
MLGTDNAGEGVEGDTDLLERVEKREVNFDEAFETEVEWPFGIPFEDDLLEVVDKDC